MKKIGLIALSLVLTIKIQAMEYPTGSSGAPQRYSYEQLLFSHTDLLKNLDESSWHTVKGKFTVGYNNMTPALSTTPPHISAAQKAYSLGEINNYMRKNKDGRWTLKSLDKQNEKFRGTYTPKTPWYNLQKPIFNILLTRVRDVRSKDGIYIPVLEARVRSKETFELNKSGDQWSIVNPRTKAYLTPLYINSEEVTEKYIEEQDKLIDEHVNKLGQFFDEVFKKKSLINDVQINALNKYYRVTPLGWKKVYTPFAYTLGISSLASVAGLAWAACTYTGLNPLMKKD